MDHNQIAILAANRSALSDDEPPHVRSLYWRLRCLYQDYESGAISKEAGAQEKAEAFRQFRADEAENIISRRCSESAEKLWKNTELAGSAYATNRTLENADRLWAAILNLPEGSRPKDAG